MTACSPAVDKYITFHVHALEMQDESLPLVSCGNYKMFTIPAYSPLVTRLDVQHIIPVPGVWQVHRLPQHAGLLHLLHINDLLVEEMPVGVERKHFSKIVCHRQGYGRSRKQQKHHNT